MIINLELKRVLSFFTAIIFSLSTIAPCFAEMQSATGVPMPSEKTEQQIDSVPKLRGNIIQGGVNYNELEENKDLFTGEIEAVEKGSILRMTVASVISSGFYRKGDEFFAEITDDFSSQSGIVLPAGTVAHGRITEFRDKKRLGRDAYLSLKFDYLITPDNRKIPIEATMTTKRSKTVSTAKVVLEDVAYTAAGGVIGGILALKFLGLGAAVASNGYTVAGGAGIGAVLGLTAALLRKGKDVLIQPGDEIRVKVNESLELPVMSYEALKDEELLLEGLNVKVLEYIVERDPFGELNTITITLHIRNNTKKTFSSFEMALLSDYNTVYYSSPFGDTGMWFKKITPGTQIRGRMSFSVDNPKKRHWLVFYDNRTRKPVAKFSLKNAERELKQLSKKRK